MNAVTVDRGTRRQRFESVAPRGSGWGISLSLAPAIALFAFAYAAPMVILVGTSFTKWSFLGIEWTGFANFERLFADPVFWRAAANTLVYCLGTLLIQVPLAVVAGILLSWHPPGWRAFRAVLFLPIVISGAAFAVVYGLFYNPSWGLFKQLLGALGLDAEVNVLFDVNLAIFAVMAAYVFIVGFGMVLVMAEIVSIPREQYEAAEVDGASRWQRERHITLPALRQVIGTAALLGILGTLKFFDLVYILTSGGPGNRTATIGTYTYTQYVNDQWGYASSIGLITLAIGVIAIVLIRRIFRIGETV